MKIGFIGLGNVGSKLAKSLLKNRYNLTVCDIDKNIINKFKKIGAKISISPSNIAKNNDIIITCLPSPQASSKVLESNDGIINGISKNKIWIEMSTTDSKEVIRLSKLIKKKGGHTLAAPVSGGCHRAAKGNISIFVGGNKNSFNKVFPILSRMGNKILYTGNLGSASILKVITNYLATINLVALGEAFTIAKKSKIDLKKSFKAIKISSGNSFVHETESQLILNGSYAIDFTMDLVLKDINLFNNLAKKYNTPLELSPKLIKIFKDGKKRYGPKAWSTMIVKRLEDDYMIKFRSKGFPSKLVDLNKKEKGIKV